MDKDILEQYWSSIYLHGCNKNWYQPAIVFVNDCKIIWDLDEWIWLKEKGLHPCNNTNFRYLFKELHLKLFLDTFDPDFLNKYDPDIIVKFFFTNINNKRKHVSFSIHKDINMRKK